jgi:hypothetical protein
MITMMMRMIIIIINVIVMPFPFEFFSEDGGGGGEGSCLVCYYREGGIPTKRVCIADTKIDRKNCHPTLNERL